MFIRSLDEKELELEEFANMTGEPADYIFPQSEIGQAMRWSKFKDRCAGASSRTETPVKYLT